MRAEREEGDPDNINPRLLFVSDELNGLSIDHFINRPRPYLPRSFPTISKIIEDIKRSRIYLGLHWNFDCTRGVESGERVAKVVYDSLYRRTRRKGHLATSGGQLEVDFAGGQIDE